MSERAKRIEEAARALVRHVSPGGYVNLWVRNEADALRAALALPVEEPTVSDEETARLINGLIEAGDLLMLHVQRIYWDPRAANVARECWLESRAKVSGDDGQGHRAPEETVTLREESHDEG